LYNSGKKDYMPYNYKMKIAYDGTKYQGWQKNKNAKETIQEKLEAVISDIVGQKIEVIGSGRTDKGVHAEGQIANFLIQKEQDIALLYEQINAQLPDDIALYAIELIDNQFHARLSAVSKTYRYTIWKANARRLPLFERKYVYKVDDLLDISKMRYGATQFIGKHDFRGFSSEKTKKNTERTINEINILEDENTIMILVNGTGFIHNMVRIMVGTLIEIGRGERDANIIGHIFEKKIREEAGFTVPAKGLFMIEVNYK